MSHYTNDIDTLRELVSRAIPALLQSAVIVIGVLAVMLYYSIWMTLIVLAGVFVMMLVSKKVGGGSAKYFIRQQKSIGKAEGFVQEMMNGQKVIKVFNHEQQCEEDFDKINEELFEDSSKAHAYANVLGPIIMNIGNILYVIIAVCGGLFILSGADNFSLSGMAFSISIVVPFMNMTKQFTGNVNQVSQQINVIVMGLAGAQRIFDLMDQDPEVDDGYVTLVNAEIDKEIKKLKNCDNYNNDDSVNNSYLFRAEGKFYKKTCRAKKAIPFGFDRICLYNITGSIENNWGLSINF